MSNLNRQIEERIQVFVSELNTLVRKAALEAVSDALTGQSGGGSSNGGGGGGRAMRQASAPSAAPRQMSSGSTGGGRGRRGGGKRTEAEIASLAKDLQDFIGKNPGLGIEKIATGLNTRTAELVLPMAKLLGSKSVRREGERRATRYFPIGGGGNGAASKGGAAKGGRGKRGK